MRQIAMLIDEEQLNKYITNDFDPAIPEDDDDDDSSTCSDDHKVHEPQQIAWESFAGWSFDLRQEVPGAVDTDESSQDVDDEQFAALDLKLAAVVEPNDDDGDPEPELADDDDDDDDEDDELLVYDLDPPVLASSILKKIAKENVRYETDSEASDSWAQDGASDTTSSGTEALTSCDPARLAFREIMNRHSEQLLSLQQEMDRLLREDSPPPPPPPPTNSPEGLDVRKTGVQYLGFSSHTSIRRLP